MHHISQRFYQFPPVANLASSIKSSIGRVFFQSWGGFDLAVTVCAGQVMRGMNLTVTALGFRRTWAGVRGLDFAGILSSYPRFLYYLRFLTGAASIASIFSVNVAQWHQMTAFERAAAQMKGLRCSLPAVFRCRDDACRLAGGRDVGQYLRNARTRVCSYGGRGPGDAVSAAAKTALVARGHGGIYGG